MNLTRTIAFLIVPFIPSVGHGAAPADQILDAKQRFFESETAVDKAIRNFFDDREAHARKRGDRELVLEIKEQLKQYDDAAIIPSGLPRVATRRFELAQSNLKRAYTKAIAEFTRDGLDANARLAEQELKQILSFNPKRRKTAVFRIPNLIQQRKLVSDVTTFTNRVYKLRDVPEPMSGWHFTSHPLRKTPKYVVEIEQPGDVHIAAITRTQKDREKIIKSGNAMGWTPSPLGHIADHGRTATWLVLKKRFDVGKYEIPVWDRDTGTLVLDPFPLER